MRGRRAWTSSAKSSGIPSTTGDTQILASLDFEMKGDAEALDIGVPGYRATRDVSIPDDIVERSAAFTATTTSAEGAAVPARRRP